MAQLAFLIQDVFSFLSLLSADDIRPIGSRYLPVSRLKQLASLLTVSDTFHLSAARNSKGKWCVGASNSSSERDAERIRFVHYIAESSHFVARTGAFLKPTPMITRWLKSSNLQVARTLFSAAFPPQPTPDDNARWRAFGLPGNHLVSPLTVEQL